MELCKLPLLHKRRTQRKTLDSLLGERFRLGSELLVNSLVPLLPILIEKVELKMKLNRHGKATILTEADSQKIYKVLKLEKYKLFWLIALFTGERWGAIRQLKVSDVYGSNGQPLSHITFRGSIRKKSGGVAAKTRQVPIHNRLMDALRGFTPPPGEFLFPSSRDAAKPITFRRCDRVLREALSKAHLDHKGYSPHSTRRTFITKLHSQGCDIRTIQEITGHKGLESLAGYVEVSSEKVAAAINLL